MTFNTLARLLEMASGLQRDMGLDDMLPLEREVLIVIGSIVEQQGRDVRTEEILSHPLMAGVARSSLHRALRRLLATGHIAHPVGAKAGRFVLKR